MEWSKCQIALSGIKIAHNIRKVSISMYANTLPYAENINLAASGTKISQVSGSGGLIVNAEKDA